MKQLLTILSYAVLLYCASCTKEEIRPFTPKDTVEIAYHNPKFKLTPTADDQFEIRVPDQDGSEYNLKLKSGGEVLSRHRLLPVVSQGYSSTLVSYDFSPDDLYAIEIVKTWEFMDTIYREVFVIHGYKHTYCDKLDSELLAPVGQLYAYDISPSKNEIYYTDYVNNTLILNRLSIPENQLEVLDEDFPSLLLRCIGEDQLLIMERTFNGRFLGTDSGALLAYTVNTKETSFIDWGSADYGRYSRVVNNSIMITRPLVYPNGLLTLIDLTDYSSLNYSADFRYLREYNFDNIYVGNHLFDFTTLGFVDRLPFLNSRSFIQYYDKQSKYYLVTEYFESPVAFNELFSRMLIFRNSELVYEQPFEKGRTLTFPRIMSLEDDKLIFYQYYDYDTVVRYDGYYQLTISTGEIEPLQYVSDAFVGDLFFVEDTSSFISVGSKGISRVTINF